MVLMSPCSSMPNPTTGLPVLAMPSTTLLVHPSSMPMTTTAATFGLLPMPISVRQCHRALDVVGHRLACGVGEVVQRQNDHVVAYANPAVLAAPAPKCEISVRLSRHDAIPLGAYQRFVLRLWT
jgi:hypothetical protein